MKFPSLVAFLAACAVLSGCSLMPSNINALEDGAAQIAVQSSERTICRDLPVGAWIKMYGASVSRLQGWQDLCFNPVVTPLNEATMAALLKAYPNFANNPPATPTVPVSTNVPTQAVQIPAASATPANVLPPGIPITGAPMSAPRLPPRKATRAKPAAVTPPVVTTAPAPAVPVPSASAPSAFGTLAPNPNFRP